MSTPNEITWAQLKHVNLDKAWKILQRTDRGGLLLMLARALRSAQPGQLESIFSDFAHPHEVGDIEAQALKPLLEPVREFTEAALRGEFYVGASRNIPDPSGATYDFEAQLDLSFDRCVTEAVNGNPVEVCEAYELLFDLLREIDKFERDIVFFADEGGVWQFGINWQRVLPGYIQSLAKTVSAEDLERQATAVIEEFVDAWHRGGLRLLLSGLMKTNTRPTVLR